MEGSYSFDDVELLLKLVPWLKISERKLDIYRTEYSITRRFSYISNKSVAT